MANSQRQNQNQTTSSTHPNSVYTVHCIHLVQKCKPLFKGWLEYNYSPFSQLSKNATAYHDQIEVYRWASLRSSTMNWLYSLRTCHFYRGDPVTAVILWVSLGDVLVREEGLGSSGYCVAWEQCYLYFAIHYFHMNMNQRDKLCQFLPSWLVTGYCLSLH